MSNEVTVYERVDNPLEFAREMGKAMALSGIFGCRNEQQGIVLAMACMSERKNPIELARTYHIIDGKLSMRADAMLAEFRARGGKHRWLATGDDHQRAEIELELNGQKEAVAFTIEDAHRAELVKPKSGWVKFPGEMLRARAISKAIRMIAPEIVAGCYVPEELEDGQVIDVQVEPAEKPLSAKEQMRKRAAAKGRKAGNGESESAAALQTKDEPMATEPAGMEASPPSASGDGTEAAPTPRQKPIGVSAESLKLIEQYGVRVYGDQWPDKRAKVCAMHGVGRVASLNQEQLDGLLNHLKAKELGLKN